MEGNVTADSAVEWFDRLCFYPSWMGESDR